MLPHKVSARRIEMALAEVVESDVDACAARIVVKWAQTDASDVAAAPVAGKNVFAVMRTVKASAAEHDPFVMDRGGARDVPTENAGPVPMPTWIVPPFVAIAADIGGDINLAAAKFVGTANEADAVDPLRSAHHIDDHRMVLAQAPGKHIIRNAVCVMHNDRTANNIAAIRLQPQRFHPAAETRIGGVAVGMEPDVDAADAHVIRHCRGRHRQSCCCGNYQNCCTFHCCSFHLTLSKRRSSGRCNLNRAQALIGVS